MKKVLMYFKKDMAVNLFVIFELFAVTLLIGVIIAMSSYGKGDKEVATLCAYLGVVTAILLVMTTITDKVVNKEKNRYFYSVCFSLGETKNSIFIMNTVKTVLITAVALIITWIIVPIMDPYGDQFLIKNKETAIATFIVIGYTALLIALDAVIIYYSNMLKDFHGGNDNE